MDKETNYKKLRDFRVDNDLKQKQVAAILNITPSAYSRIERGNRGMRVEILQKIAEFFGKDINELLNKTENNGPQNMKTEIVLLESIISLISIEVESNLFSLMDEYLSKYPEYTVNPESFEDYLIDPNFGLEMAVSQIKSDIEYYIKDGSSHSIYSQCGENGIEHLINRDDKWLLEFVSQKENYDIVNERMYSGYYQKDEDIYSAFREMLNENPVFYSLFQYGLLETSWYSDCWVKYLEEVEKSPSVDTLDKDEIFFQLTEIEITEKRKERERIREKMKSVLSRKHKT